MTSEKAPELKPCPFCGGEAEIAHIEDGENAGGSCVSCKKCLASGNVEFGFKENFVSNWNRRADVADAMVAAAYEAAADKCFCPSWPVKTSTDHVQARTAGLIRSLTPSDARTALAEAERKAWEAGRDAAAEAAYQWWDDDDAQELREHLRALKKEPEA